MCKIIMPEGSLAEFSDAASVRAAARSSGLRPAQIALLLALNAVPLLHAALVVAAVAFTPGAWAARIGAGAATLYLLPPLVVRAILAGGRPNGRVAYGSRGFCRARGLAISIKQCSTQTLFLMT